MRMTKKLRDLYVESRKNYGKEFEWLCTDDDSHQHCRRIGVAPLDDVYELIQVQEVPDGKFAIAHGVINLPRYTEEDLNEVCFMYFDMSFEVYENSDFFCGYGPVAEAIFETEALCEHMDFSIGLFDEMEEAINAVNRYMAEHNAEADIKTAMAIPEEVMAEAYDEELDDIMDVMVDKAESFELGGVEIVLEDCIRVYDMMWTENVPFETACDAVLSDIRDILDAGLEAAAEVASS